METQDIKTGDKFDFEQLGQSFQNQASRLWGAAWEKELTGIFLEACPNQEPEKRYRLQIHHNSGHALWFLSMIVHSIIHGNAAIRNGAKTKRVLGHLTCLREFIDTEEVRLKWVVERLFKAILTEFPDDPVKWTHFMYHHWFLVRAFAEQFGQHDKCFPEESYRRVSDIVGGRQYFRFWWWDLQISKLTKSLVHGNRVVIDRLRR